jgi:hypothetical protein
LISRNYLQQLANLRRSEYTRAYTGALCGWSSYLKTAEVPNLRFGP